MKTTFIYIGKIQPKQRPKASRRGRFISVYTPKETIISEQDIAKQYKAAGHKNYGEAFVNVHITCFVKTPKSYANRKHELIKSNKLFPKTFDVDNLAKTALDGLNGVAYNDDSQVVGLSCTKLFGKEDYSVITIED
jgi:Holliday junction resolvase RusA-like endonuclease